MKFIQLLGKTTPVLINIQNISVVEKTKDGCKIYIAGGSVTTGADYDEVVSAIEQSCKGGDAE